MYYCTALYFPISLQPWCNPHQHLRFACKRQKRRSHKQQERNMCQSLDENKIPLNIFELYRCFTPWNSFIGSISRGSRGLPDLFVVVKAFNCLPARLWHPVRCGLHAEKVWSGAVLPADQLCTPCGWGRCFAGPKKACRWFLWCCAFCIF